MLHRKLIPLQEDTTSAEKNESHFLYGKDDEIKGDNITDEKDGNIEYGNDFIICKLIHIKDSK